jgi:hypothetical protein
MKNWLRFPLGVAAGALGAALVARYGSATALALTQQGGGVALENLYAVAVGLMGLGASWDLLRRRRPPADKVGTVAKSIWGARRHVDQWGIGEN